MWGDGDGADISRWVILIALQVEGQGLRTMSAIALCSRRLEQIWMIGLGMDGSYLLTGRRGNAEGNIILLWHCHPSHLDFKA